MWPLRLVEQVYPSNDGHVRSVEVRTKKGTYTRSIQQLLQLEAVTAPNSLCSDTATTLPPILQVPQAPVEALFLFAPVIA